MLYAAWVGRRFFALITPDVVNAGPKSLLTRNHLSVTHLYRRLADQLTRSLADGLQLLAGEFSRSEGEEFWA
jgi:hypothetical protein